MVTSLAGRPFSRTSADLIGLFVVAETVTLVPATARISPEMSVSVLGSRSV